MRIAVWLMLACSAPVFGQLPGATATGGLARMPLPTAPTPPPSLPGGMSARETPVLPVSPEDLRPFQPGDVKLAWNNRRWLLTHQNQILKDFGPRGEADARLALRIIQQHNLDRHGVIGSPTPLMEYWLCGDRAPTGQVSGGLRPVPLVPARLKVEQVMGQWCVRDGGRVLFSFGPAAEDARLALAVIHKYGFDQLGVVGNSTPMMYVFFRRQQADTPSLHQGTPLSGQGRQMTPHRFSRLAKDQDGKPKFEAREPAPESNKLNGLVAPVVPALTVPEGPRERPMWKTEPHFGSRKAQTVEEHGERTVFDWRRVELRQELGVWRMRAGGMVLAEFGADVAQAQLAWQALKYYRFTEKWRGNGPDAPAYFSTSGPVNRGVMVGLSPGAFDPEKLQVVAAGQGHAIQGEKGTVLGIGGKWDEAQRLVETMKRQQFDRVCTLGDTGTGKGTMTFLMRSQ